MARLGGWLIPGPGVDMGGARGGWARAGHVRRGVGGAWLGHGGEPKVGPGGPSTKHRGPG